MKKHIFKVICVLLALAMFTVFAVSSSSSNDENSEATASGSSDSGKATETSKTTETSKITETSKDSGESITYTIKDEVIVDNDKCSFVIKEATNDLIWGLKFNVVCENKMSDTDLMFSVSDVSVNGYMVSAVLAESVAAGKKSNDDISFLSSLKDNGITSVDELTFNLRIYDNDDWTADNIVNQTVTVYPTGKQKSEIVIPERKTTAGEKVIIDNEYCKFIILEDGKDIIGRYELKCYIENKTDEKITVSWRDVSVNGYMMSTLAVESITPGNRVYSDVAFSTSDFEDNDIETVEEVEFRLCVYNYLDILSDKYVDEVFTYKP